ncbi:hypothetical protein BHW_0900054 (plasmid) [Borrelia hermsii MTW]|uniref:Uncharacterized protein n=1 Tax=Borrelia hermsii MTW TaxID=1313291 RepID=W5T5Y0_BORHE|nr:hypothetical protein BHW_0900054 [Borrelia hermsii MTW]
MDYTNCQVFICPDILPFFLSQVCVFILSPFLLFLSLQASNDLLSLSPLNPSEVLFLTFVFSP